MNVAHLLIDQAAQRPDATAIIQGCGARTRTISFAQMDERSAKMAGVLVKHGVGVGDHVLIFVPMSINLYAALIAVFRVGANATFLDPSAGRAHITQCCEMVHPKAMIASSMAHLLRLVLPALRNIPVKFSVGCPIPGAMRWVARSGLAPLREIAPREPDDPALVTFTSGSTGRPKAAVRTHGFLAAQQEALRHAIELVPGDIDLSTLPIFTLVNLACGVTSLIPDCDLKRPGAVDAGPVMRQIAQHGATRAVASPAFFERLLQHTEHPDAWKSILRIYTGGAPVFPGLLQRLQRAMPAAQVVSIYGSTEAEPIAHIAWGQVSAEDAHAMLAGRGLLAGPIVRELDLRIIPNQWGKPIPPMNPVEYANFVLPPGETGEIVVHGAHVLKGYLNGVGDEQTKFRVEGEVWHRTGDAGYIDEHQRLWLLGRAEARIHDSRGTVYPFAVECAASQVPGVRRSALLSREGKRLLVIEIADNPSVHQANVERLLRSAISWAAIDRIVFLPRIPVDQRHNAKIDYPALRRALGG